MAGHPWTTQPKVVVSYATFTWWISSSKKSKKLMHYFQRYWRSKNSAIWFDKSILTYNLWTKIFLEMWFGWEQRELKSLSFLVIPSKKKQQNFMKTKKTLYFRPILGLFAHFRACKIFAGKCACHFSLFLNFHRCAKFRKKTNEQIPRKTDY